MYMSMYASVCVFTTGKINIGIIQYYELEYMHMGRKEMMGLKICTEEVICKT